MRKGVAAGIAVFAAALATAGCNVVPHKAYDGPSRLDRDLSFLRGGAYGEQLSPVSLVDLRTIDGVPQRERMYLASVLPGRHVIGLSERLSVGSLSRIQFCAFNLETVAGCRYAPRPPTPPADAVGSRTAWEWVVDMPVVAECTTDGGFQMRVSARCGSTEKVFDRPPQ